jgi:hypothetical protein
MESLDLRDRAKLVMAELELQYELGGAVPNELVVAAIHRHSTSPEDSWALLEAVREEMGLQAPPGAPVSAAWLLVGALGLVVWVLAFYGAWHLVSGMI